MNEVPDLDTNSMSLPERWNSSFCPGALVMLTPCNMVTCLVYFSPKKFLMETDFLSSETVTLMGKWAYTDLILYKNPWNIWNIHCNSKANEIPRKRFLYYFKCSCLLLGFMHNIVKFIWQLFQLSTWAGSWIKQWTFHKLADFLTWKNPKSLVAFST